MNHEESKLQQQCVAWFRAQYPMYAMLLTHPANEGNGNRVSGAIHKAEGTVAGVPDLLLFMPAIDYTQSIYGTEMHGLGIELKTAKGSQSQLQKDYQKMFEAAGYRYAVIRSLDAFMEEINSYIAKADVLAKNRITNVHLEIVKARELKEKEHFYKVIGKK